jgi:hypothetical protein
MQGVKGVWCFFRTRRSQQGLCSSPGWDFFGSFHARSVTKPTASPGGNAKHFCVEAKMMSQPISFGKCFVSCHWLRRCRLQVLCRGSLCVLVFRFHDWVAYACGGLVVAYGYVSYLPVSSFSEIMSGLTALPHSTSMKSACLPQQGLFWRIVRRKRR